MSNHPTGGDEKDVPIPPPRVFAMAAAVGGLVGAAAGAMLAIWLIGCCCDDDADTRTSRVEATITAAVDPVRLS